METMTEIAQKEGEIETVRRQAWGSNTERERRGGGALCYLDVNESKVSSQQSAKMTGRVN